MKTKWDSYLEKVDWYVFQEYTLDYIHNIIYSEVNWDKILEDEKNLDQDKLDSANKISDDIWRIVKMCFYKKIEVPNTALIVYNYLLKNRVIKYARNS